MDNRYRQRMPRAADFLHIVNPCMFRPTFKLSRFASNIYILGSVSHYSPSLLSLTFHLGHRKIKRNQSPELFSTLVLDTSSHDGELFVLALKVKILSPKSCSRTIQCHHFNILILICKFQDEFRRLLPKLDLDDYFISGHYHFGLPKSLGTVTAVDLSEDVDVHSNWAAVPCVRFRVGELRIIDYIRLLGML